MAKLTKTEQTLLDRVKEQNDRGQTCWDPVKNNQGARCGWRYGGGRESSGPNKLETAAWKRMIARGDVIKCPEPRGYAVPGHPVLAQVASNLDLAKRARLVHLKRRELEVEEQYYAEAQAFVRKYGLGIEP